MFQPFKNKNPGGNSCTNLIDFLEEQERDEDYPVLIIDPRKVTRR